MVREYKAIDEISNLAVPKKTPLIDRGRNSCSSGLTICHKYVNISMLFPTNDKLSSAVHTEILLY